MTRQVISSNSFLEELLRRRAFIGGGTLSGLALNFSHIQLFNPVGSGINIIVTSITASQGSGVDVNVAVNTAALSTNITSVGNQFAGGPAPVATLNSENNTTQFGTVISREPQDAAENIINIVKGNLFALEPGNGVLVNPVNQNSSLEASYSWLEFPR